LGGRLHESAHRHISNDFLRHQARAGIPDEFDTLKTLQQPGHPIDLPEYQAGGRSRTPQLGQTMIGESDTGTIPRIVFCHCIAD
jgi:hypothetical protein